MKKYRNIAYVMAGLLLLAGAGMTIPDYNRWRHAERDKFGQGVAQPTPMAEKLESIYQNEMLGIRLKYPKGWQVTEDPRWAGVTIWTDGIKKGERAEVAGFDTGLTLIVERNGKGMADAADTEVKNLTTTGGKLTREREYINTDAVNITLLTRGQWQVGLIVSGEKEWVLEADETKGINEATFTDILKSVVLF